MLKNEKKSQKLIRSQKINFKRKLVEDMKTNTELFTSMLEEKQKQRQQSQM